jgi:hypothetical protein
MTITETELITTVIVELDERSIRAHQSVAIERWLAKRHSKNRENYEKGLREGRLEHELLANFRSMLAEHAVAIHYGWVQNFPWYPNEEHNRRKNLPDVGGNVEVRTCRTRESIAVWEKDHGKVIYGVRCLDEAFFTKFEILGAISFEEVAMHDDWVDPWFGGWAVPLSALHPANTQTST